MLIEKCVKVYVAFTPFTFQISLSNYCENDSCPTLFSVKRMWKFVTRDHPSSIPLLEFILLLQYEFVRTKRASKEKKKRIQMNEREWGGEGGGSGRGQFSQRNSFVKCGILEVQDLDSQLSPDSTLDCCFSDQKFVSEVCFSPSMTVDPNSYPKCERTKKDEIFRCVAKWAKEGKGSDSVNQVLCQLRIIDWRLDKGKLNKPEKDVPLLLIHRMIGSTFPQHLFPTSNEFCSNRKYEQRVQNENGNWEAEKRFTQGLRS